MRTILLALVFAVLAANAWAYCGDGVCNIQGGESRSNCCTDCSCGFGEECSSQDTCEFYSDSSVEATGFATSQTRLYGFDGVYASLIAAVAIGVLVLYKLRK